MMRWWDQAGIDLGKEDKETKMDMDMETETETEKEEYEIEDDAERAAEYMQDN